MSELGRRRREFAERQAKKQDNALQRINRRQSEEIAEEADRQVSAVVSGGESAFDRESWLGVVTRVTVAGMVDALKIGLGETYTVASTRATDEFLLGIDVGGVRLSDRLRQSADEAAEVVRTTLRGHMAAKTTWDRVARDLDRASVSIGDLPRYLTTVTEAARNILLSPYPTADEVAAVRSLLAGAWRRADALAKNGAPTGYLKTAYREVLGAARIGDKNLLEKKLAVAMERKARYNNERIARTEMARLYQAGLDRRIADDPDLKWVKYELSGGHVVPDECDVFAEADLFGMGDGVYPAGEAPRIPDDTHPQCLCVMYPIAGSLLDDRPVFNPSAAEEAIERVGMTRGEAQRAHAAVLMLGTKRGPKTDLPDNIVSRSTM